MAKNFVVDMKRQIERYISIIIHKLIGSTMKYCLLRNDEDRPMQRGKTNDIEREKKLKYCSLLSMKICFYFDHE